MFDVSLVWQMITSFSPVSEVKPLALSFPPLAPVTRHPKMWTKTAGTSKSLNSLGSECIVSSVRFFFYLFVMQLNNMVCQQIKANKRMCAVCRDPQARSDDAGQRILDNLSPSAVDRSSSATLEHVTASCKSQINHPDYWINLRTLCNRVLGGSGPPATKPPVCVKACLCAYVHVCMSIDVDSLFFFLFC